IDGCAGEVKPERGPLQAPGLLEREVGADKGRDSLSAALDVSLDTAIHMGYGVIQLELGRVLLRFFELRDVVTQTRENIGPGWGVGNAGTAMRGKVLAAMPIPFGGARRAAATVQASAG